MVHIIWINLSSLSLQTEPCQRTTLNFVMVTAVIRWLDETVKDKILFCLHFVRKNTHWFMRWFLSIVKLSLHSKLFQILHALGLLHEHQRPDRDQYIDVDMAAIAKTGALRQFQKDGFLEVQIINFSDEFGLSSSNASSNFQENLKVQLDFHWWFDGLWYPLHNALWWNFERLFFTSGHDG